VDFKPNYPIYLQVADFICERVLKGEWCNGDKLPALKDLAITTSVNPNTVIKALGFLVDHDILSTQRGVGYFLTENALALTQELKRRQFVDEALPAVFASMDLLGLTLDELNRIYGERHAAPAAPARSNDNEPG
jgi:DNA-binding transcriptional regulator YhcF (GntR family)